MAPHHPTSDSESSDEEGAPEIISLAQSKKDIQKLDAELKKAEIAERQSKRRQNRELDRKLKERADMNKSGQKKKKGGEEAGGLEEEDRMQRAMREAQEEEEEMDEEDESESGSEDGGSDSSSEDSRCLPDWEFSGSEDSRCLVGEKGSGSKHSRSRYLVDEEGSVQSEEEGEEEEEEDSAEEIPPPNPKKKPYNPDYLPDELFTAAFASQASASKRKATEDVKDTEQTLKKKQKRSHTQKDLIVGSRAIRVLPTSGKPITPSAAPSSKVKKFLDRSLALKGKNQKMWERRPANIGVLRREGPASNFVRNR